MKKPELGWKDLNWKQIENHIFKLQEQIYSSAKKGEIKTVRKFQKGILRHPEAKLLAVRKVTQDNRGKSTPGLDGIKSLSPQERLELAKNLRITSNASPVKRIYIPKPGKNEVRPLGIPTIEDRARQALVKLALEPEWEAYFEPNSYGFRPGRNCHDAIKQIQISIAYMPKYVLDADISKCFDSINHHALLKKINQRGLLQKQIKAWLKAGYVVFPNKKVTTTEVGTPQGGVLSPLLANIALHGLETNLKEISAKVPQNFSSGNPKSREQKLRSLTVVRYADDFVVMHENYEILLLCKLETEKFLQSVGLKLSESKTRITHSLNDSMSQDGKAGFNFLGFTIKQESERIRSVRNRSTGESLGFRTLIIPSKKSLKSHQKVISEKIRLYTDQNALIANLNPVISGWSRYFGVSHASLRGILQNQDELLYRKLKQWGYRRTLSRKLAFKRYWIHDGKKWAYGNKQYHLYFHRDYASSIVKYPKVKGNMSPFDRNTSYWTQRLINSPNLPITKQKLLNKQNGICSFCELRFQPNDLMEIHHKKPRKEGGTDRISNLEIVHGHCHDQLHNKLKRIL
uniref:Putative reverse transcriptase and intron maturase n=1 Tax=Pedinomonas tuberculata TaxID=160064 RepID=A0A097KLB2_9CHLO|nr:putative reverse transcriptase and intron maturase [Pedinomonas tuberculata]AIT93953.1 putative reverse transcriptase and intron maturase [Pedinomonas tuberculata]